MEPTIYNDSSAQRPIQSEETNSTVDVASVAQYNENEATPHSSAAMINESTAAAVQPKTILIQNLTTIGMQKASPTIRTSWKINGQQQQQQTSCGNRSGLAEINDGINGGSRQSRVETPAAAAKPTNESTETTSPITDLQQASEEDVDVEYEVKQYVIEEIESTATVVINQPQTVRDLLEKVTSNPLVLGLVFLILGITLLCILAEGEISLAWTLFAISMASLIVFGGMKM